VQNIERIFDFIGVCVLRYTLLFSMALEYRTLVISS